MLRGFELVTLRPGERRRVSIELTPMALSIWDSAAHARAIPSGRFEAFVGTSSRALPLRGAFDVVGSP